MNYSRILFVFFLLCLSCKENSKHRSSTQLDDIAERRDSSTSYYLIRHAEKDLSDSSNDPKLTNEGKLRAQRWAEQFKDVEFDAVYTTNFKRTRETARPTAKKNHVKLTYYDPRSLEIQEFLKKTEGKNVLIVGHSETTPKMVNTIIKERKYQSINDNDYSQYFVIFIENGVITEEKFSMP